MGVVGRGKVSRSGPLALAISLARAFCLPPRDRRISLHGLDVGSRARLVNRACLRPCSTGGGDRRICWERSAALAKSPLGTWTSLDRPPAHDDSNGGGFPVELSLVAPFSSHSCPLRGRSVAIVVDGRDFAPF